MCGFLIPELFASSCNQCTALGNVSSDDSLNADEFSFFGSLPADGSALQVRVFQLKTREDGDGWIGLVVSNAKTHHHYLCHKSHERNTDDDSHKIEI